MPAKAACCALLLMSLSPVAVRAQVTPPGTKPVSVEIQDMIEDKIAGNLPLPQTADWHFDFTAPYAGGGDVVCGSVDYESLSRKYVGAKRFYVLIYRHAITLAQLQDPPSVDVTGQEAVKFHLLCDRK